MKISVHVREPELVDARACNCGSQTGGGGGGGGCQNCGGSNKCGIHPEVARLAEAGASVQPPLS